MSIDDEQMMLPTNPDDMQASSLRAKLPSQEAADADSTSSLQPLQKPLQAGGSLLSKQAVMQSLRAREDGMERSSSAMTRTEVHSKHLLAACYVATTCWWAASMRLLLVVVLLLEVCLAMQSVDHHARS